MRTSPTFRPQKRRQATTGHSYAFATGGTRQRVEERVGSGSGLEPQHGQMPLPLEALAGGKQLDVIAQVPLSRFEVCDLGGTFLGDVDSQTNYATSTSLRPRKGHETKSCPFSASASGQQPPKPQTTQCTFPIKPK